MGEIVLPPSHNTVAVCHQVTFLILHYITSRLVPLLKVTDAPIQVPNVLDHTVGFKFLNFSSNIWLFFVPEVSANFTSYIVQDIYIALAWILYPLQFSPLPLMQKNLNILHQTTVYSGSIRADPDSLLLRFAYSL